MTRRTVQTMIGTIFVLALVVPAGAGAATQTIDATLGSSVSMTTSPTASISGWALSATGANTVSGGSMTIQANTPYTVTVAGDQAKMTEYITGTSSYVTPSPKQLTAALSVIPTLSSGAGVPVASLAVGTVAAPLAAGTGLTTDSYALTLSQTTAITDSPLAAGRTYHIVLTYTASAVL